MDKPLIYFDTIIGGQISQIPEESTLKLIVDSTSGSTAYRTSKIYYNYIAGEGTYVLMSMSLGDNGKENVLRRWGIFDDFDGIYFELNGTEFSVNIRSSVNGGVPLTKITRDNFNGDRLNDVNISTFIIDFSKFNLFWIDYQWLGVGKVRFGTISPTGERITIHSIENANRNNRPYMKTGTLPLRFGISNTSATASTSEMKIVCIQVAKETGNINYESQVYVFGTSTTKTIGDEFVPLASVQPKETINGIRNRTVILLHELHFLSTTQPIIVELRTVVSLTGATFTANQNPFTSINIDIDATAVSQGHTVSKWFVDKGTESKTFRDSVKNSILNNPSGVQPIYTFVAKSAVQGQTTDVLFGGDWKEYY